MSLEEFCLLSNEDQFEIVFRQGIFIENYSTAQLKFNLYSIDKFFVEIQYDPISNKIIGKKAFVDGELLNKYTIDY